jgi:hypothetical protein
MTALTQYQRLEATGIWRKSAEAQRLDVIISIGESSLVITDINEKPLAHWSLAALAVVQSKDGNKLYHPDGDPGETLELGSNENEMAKAIEKVMKAVDRRRPKPGRLRIFSLASILIVILGLSIFWLPAALRDYTQKIIPEVREQEMGKAVFNEFISFVGAPCSRELGIIALDKFSSNLGLVEYSFYIVPSETIEAIHLPGKIIVISKALVEDFDDPDVVAGHILAQIQREAKSNALDELMKQMNNIEIIQFLLGKSPDASTLREFSKDWIIKKQLDIDLEILMNEFNKRAISALPYSYAIDVTGQNTQIMINSEKISQKVRKPSLDDSAWLALQTICGG